MHRIWNCAVSAECNASEWQARPRQQQKKCWISNVYIEASLNLLIDVSPLVYSLCGDSLFWLWLAKKKRFLCRRVHCSEQLNSGNSTTVYLTGIDRVLYLDCVVQSELLFSCCCCFFLLLSAMLLLFIYFYISCIGVVFFTHFLFSKEKKRSRQAQKWPSWPIESARVRAQKGINRCVAIWNIHRHKSVDICIKIRRNNQRMKQANGNKNAKATWNTNNNKAKPCLSRSQATHTLKPMHTSTHRRQYTT